MNWFAPIAVVAVPRRKRGRPRTLTVDALAKLQEADASMTRLEMVRVFGVSRSTILRRLGHKGFDGSR